MRKTFFALVLALTACGSDRDGHAPSLPSSLTLASQEATVQLSLSPSFGMRIVRADGKTVLETADVAIDATHREQMLGPSLLEGYDHVQAADEPPLRPLRVIAETHDGGEAILTLRDPDEPDTTFTLGVRVDGGDVEIDARVERDRADGTRALNLIGQSFVSPPDEHFVGLGEREATVDHRGRHYQNWTEEGGIGGGEKSPAGPGNPQPNGPGMTHIPMPWLLSSRGYALWIDTTYRTGFDLSATDESVTRVYAVEPRLHYHVFVTGSPAEALATFTARTGRARLPAPWTFGPRHHMGGGASANGVPEWDAIRAADIAVTVGEDSTHFLPHASDTGREEALAAWTSALHARGFKALGYYNPYVSTSRPAAADLIADARARDILVKLDDGSEFTTYMISGGGQQVATLDLTKPEAVQWFRDRMDKALGLGYDGWMLDFGEYLPPHALLANGMTGFEAHNLYPLLEAQAAYDHLRAVRGDDFLIYMRSGYVGIAAHTTQVWSGDPSASFDDSRGLPAQVRAGVNAGLSGIPFWGSDVGGYSCVSDPPGNKEVLLRWAAFGALSPDMHDENACAGARDGAKKWWIWDDAETTALYGKYTRLHTHLFPYLYASAFESTRSGMPIMRAPLLMHPDLDAAWRVTGEYYFGPALYVAPVVTRGATTRTFWLPPGEWFDWWTGAYARGDKQITRDAPLDIIPMYLRAGEVVTMLPDDVRTLMCSDAVGVVDRCDRAGQYDVRVGLTDMSRFATTALVDGAQLGVSYEGGEIPSPAVVETLADGTRRVSVETVGDANFGTLRLHAPAGMRVRWSIFIR